MVVFAVIIKEVNDVADNAGDEDKGAFEGERIHSSSPLLRLMIVVDDVDDAADDAEDAGDDEWVHVDSFVDCSVVCGYSSSLLSSRPERMEVRPSRISMIGPMMYLLG